MKAPVFSLASLVVLALSGTAASANNGVLYDSPNDSTYETPGEFNHRARRQAVDPAPTGTIGRNESIDDGKMLDPATRRLFDRAARDNNN